MDWFQLRHAADRTNSKFNGTAVDSVASVPETSSFPLMVPFHLCSINTDSFFTRRRTRNVEMQQPTMLDFQKEPSAKRTTSGPQGFRLSCFSSYYCSSHHRTLESTRFVLLSDSLTTRDHEPSHTRIRIKRCLNSRFVVERTKDHTVIRLHYSDDDCTQQQQRVTPNHQQQEEPFCSFIKEHGKTRKIRFDDLPARPKQQ